MPRKAKLEVVTVEIDKRDLQRLIAVAKRDEAKKRADYMEKPLKTRRVEWVRAMNLAGRVEGLSPVAEKKIQKKQRQKVDNAE